MDCRTEETELELCYYFIISSSSQEPMMVKQADHNSPLVKGQSGVEGGWRERQEEEFIFLQFY